MKAIAVNALNVDHLGVVDVLLTIVRQAVHTPRDEPLAWSRQARDWAERDFLQK